jgi:hypothetical protein
MNLPFHPSDFEIRKPQQVVPLWALQKGNESLSAELRLWSDGGCDVRFSHNGEFLYTFRHSNPTLAIRHAAGLQTELESCGWQTETPQPTLRPHPARQRSGRSPS